MLNQVVSKTLTRPGSLQELVVESLVVSLAMVVVDVLAHEETHVPFAEGDDATETLLIS